MKTADELAIARMTTVNYWGRYSLSDLQKSIKRLNMGRTHELISSLKFSHNGSITGDDKAVFEFNYYGKFADMQVGRGRKLEDLKSNREVSKILGEKRKNTKWLSKSLYTNIAALKQIMQEKYAEDSAQIIREGISNSINISM
jgi:hypothetical protein